MKKGGSLNEGESDVGVGFRPDVGVEVGDGTTPATFRQNDGGGGG